MKLAKIGVIGGGAWGTALSQVAAAQGGDVLLWALEAEVVAAINAAHENGVYLPGIPLAPSIRAVADLTEMEDRDALLVVTPAQHLRKVLGQMADCAKPLILCAKGIEAGTRKLMSEAAAEACPGAPIAVLSGPTFAHEVAVAGREPAHDQLAGALEEDQPHLRAALAQLVTVDPAQP